MGDILIKDPNNPTGDPNQTPPIIASPPKLEGVEQMNILEMLNGKKASRFAKQSWIKYLVILLPFGVIILLIIMNAKKRK